MSLLFLDWFKFHLKSIGHACVFVCSSLHCTFSLKIRVDLQLFLEPHLVAAEYKRCRQKLLFFSYILQWKKQQNAIDSLKQFKLKYECVVCALGWLFNSLGCIHILTTYWNARSSLVCSRVKESSAQMNIFSPQIIPVAQLHTRNEREGGSEKDQHKCIHTKMLNKKERQWNGEREITENKSPLFLVMHYIVIVVFIPFECKQMPRALLYNIYLFIYPLGCVVFRIILWTSSWMRANSGDIQCLCARVCCACIRFFFIHNIPLTCRSFSFFLFFCLCCCCFLLTRRNSLIQLTHFL